MRQFLHGLWAHEHGQDIVEYTLLIGFVTFATAALFLLGSGSALRGIWTSGNSNLALANTAAS